MTETNVLLGRTYRKANSSSNGNPDMGRSLRAPGGGVKGDRLLPKERPLLV